MTQNELQWGNELSEEMKELSSNITLINHALGHNCGKTKRFFFSRSGKNEIHIDGDFTSFGGYLRVDRECMELIRSYFQNKLAEAKLEFENIGKGGERSENGT